MREAKYLTYLGNRQSGTLLVKHAEAWSQWRNFPYYTGMRMRIGFDIPDDVANWIATENKSLFRIETEEMSAEDSFKEQFRLLLANYIEDLDAEVMLDLVGVCITEDAQGLPNIEVKQETTEVEKPKRSKRVRRASRSS
jgi:hypothetical protein